MERGFGDDGNISDLPWTAVFDPVANARALSAIQAEGFRAAAKLVDRFVSIAEPNGNGAKPSSEDSGNGMAAANSAPNSEVDPIVSSWWSLRGRLLRSVPGVNGGASAPATFELTGRTQTGRCNCMPMARAARPRRSGCTTAVRRIWPTSACCALTCCPTTVT